jgi:hypothetical protein
VKVPKTVELGDYDIVVTATVGNSGIGVAALLEKNFKFTVNVTTPSFFETTTILKTTTEVTTQPSEGEGQKITGMLVFGKLTNFILLIISIIVLVFVIWFIRFRK